MYIRADEHRYFSNHDTFLGIKTGFFLTSSFIKIVYFGGMIMCICAVMGYNLGLIIAPVLTLIFFVIFYYSNSAHNPWFCYESIAIEKYIKHFNRSNTYYYISSSRIPITASIEVMSINITSILNKKNNKKNIHGH